MDKPFRTTDEQIECLNKRFVTTDDNTRFVLEREGYYSVVNGYKDVFIDKWASGNAGDDRFYEGTTFGDIYRLFCFDRDLRLTMLRYFTIAEAALKTACAYSFSDVYRDKPDAYLDVKVYRQESEYRARVRYLTEDFYKILNPDEHGDTRFKRQYIEHYVMNHDNVPMWVLANYLTLTQIFKFFEFQKESMRNRIAKAFSRLYAEAHGETLNVYEKDLRLIYDHIKDFRNLCAHDERLYCARVSPSRDTSLNDVMNDLKKVITKEEYKRMRRDVVGLVMGVMNDIGGKRASCLISKMGISSFEETFIE